MTTASSGMPMRSIPTRLPITWAVAALSLVLVVVAWMSLNAERDPVPTDVHISRSL